MEKALDAKTLVRLDKPLDRKRCATCIWPGGSRSPLDDTAPPITNLFLQSAAFCSIFFIVRVNARAPSFKQPAVGRVMLDSTTVVSTRIFRP
jgi:hypothetical protein